MIRELTYEERRVWGICPVCEAKPGESCSGDVGIPLGIAVDGGLPANGVHLARLAQAPRQVDEVLYPCAEEGEVFDWRDKFRRWGSPLVRPGETPLWKVEQIADMALSAFDQDQKRGVCNEMTEQQVVLALTALQDIARICNEG